VARGCAGHDQDLAIGELVLLHDVVTPSAGHDDSYLHRGRARAPDVRRAARRLAAVYPRASTIQGHLAPRRRRRDHATQTSASLLG
jgi:hypothetical protein